MKSSRLTRRWTVLPNYPVNVFFHFLRSQIILVFLPISSLTITANTVPFLILSSENNKLITVFLTG